MMGWYFENRNLKTPTNTIVLDYQGLGNIVELPVIMEVIGIHPRKAPRKSGRIFVFEPVVW